MVTDEFAFKAHVEAQVNAPPVAVISGAVLFSGTVAVADTVQPPGKVAVTVYVPPALTEGFCKVEVKLFGPAQA